MNTKYSLKCCMSDGGVSMCIFPKIKELWTSLMVLLLKNYSLLKHNNIQNLLYILFRTLPPT